MELISLTQRTDYHSEDIFTLWFRDADRQERCITVLDMDMHGLKDLYMSGKVPDLMVMPTQGAVADY